MHPSITLHQIATLLNILRKSIGVSALRRLVDAVTEQADGLGVPQLPAFKTAAELLSDAGRLPPMLVEGLLPDHSLFLLTGKPKAGKSFLALDLANSISRGLPVLGTLPVNRPGPVLYLAMEDGQIELARRLAQRGQESTAPANPLYFITQSFSLTDPLHYARFREMIREIAPPNAGHTADRPADPSLIVIDTAAEALDIRDWINRSEILTKIAPIRKLARDFCTVLLVAHNRKAEGDMGDEIAGSNALAGAVDGWISAHKVERRPNGNCRLFLRIEGRGGGHELIAEMDHLTLRFSQIPTDQAEADAAEARNGTFSARQEQRRALARKTLQALGRPITIVELAVAMGLSYKIAWILVRDMTAEGEIEEIADASTDEQSGRKTPIFRLKGAENTLVS